MEGFHRLLDRSVGIESVALEDVHVVKLRVRSVSWFVPETRSSRAPEAFRAKPVGDAKSASFCPTRLNSYAP